MGGGGGRESEMVCTVRVEPGARIDATKEVW